MSYIDAGYAIALSVLFLYGAFLWLRHRRLERLALSIASSAALTSSEAEPVPGAEEEG